MKRIFDLIFGIIILIIFFIPILLISLLIKLDTNGPIIYYSDRVGKDNKIFKMPKFRTMFNKTKLSESNKIKNPEKKIKNADFKGKINVDIGEDSDYIYVTIIDNGLGFDQVDKIKMFTPYYTTKKEGTGLGLAIVNKIINDHDGKIYFKAKDY